MGLVIACPNCGRPTGDEITAAEWHEFCRTDREPVTEHDELGEAGA